ncbi:uncharacterized protein METZ01_LOCUS486144, partial [marine metagenome]
MTLISIYAGSGFGGLLALHFSSLHINYALFIARLTNSNDLVRQKAKLI